MTPVDPIKKKLFLEGMYLKYGYDFREYSEASLDRRLNSLLDLTQTTDLLDVLKEILNDSELMRRCLPCLTINTTEFFRDTEFFAKLTSEVFPVLATYPSVRVWSAGCSTGQEVISLCILLDEAGLLERTTIYATDINPQNLLEAKKGIFDSRNLKDFAKNYVKAGGVRSPSDYYTADYNLIKFDPRLLKNVVFSEHNLVTDSVFVECHLILCRNVLIYFNKKLQERVFKLFLNSLSNGGFLGIGGKESLRLSSVNGFFSDVDSRLNIFRRKNLETSLDTEIM